MNNFASLSYYSGRINDDDPIRALLPVPDQFIVENVGYCTLFPNETEIHHFESVPHQILWEYWQNMRGGREIARYEQIDPMDFNRAIGFVLLLEPNKDVTDFRYRVYGSSVAQHFGQEMTGKWLSDFGDTPGKLSLAQYPAVVKIRKPIYSEHDAANLEFHVTRWTRLILPMENRDGVIDRILVGAVPQTK